MTTRISQQALDLATETVFSRLQVVEFWMPQYGDGKDCNLRCRHCYVPSGAPRTNMTPMEYLKVLENVMGTPAYSLSEDGKWDIVFPGMEPLLPRNIPLLSELINKADMLGARSIGLTTNGTLFNDKVLGWLAECPVTNVNVSLDGTQEVHDQIRGCGKFKKTTRGIGKLRAHISRKNLRVITNTTITAANSHILHEVTKISTGLGCNFASFHPFERADNADNSFLALPHDQLVTATRLLIGNWENETVGSVSLEFEASTAGIFFSLFDEGVFNQGWEILSDDSDFLFIRKKKEKCEFLVSLMFMPHHFIRTLRVNPDGGLSSCRGMALSAWESIGDLRRTSLEQIRDLPATTQALAMIWQEYLDSVSRINPCVIQRYYDFLSERG